MNIEILRKNLFLEIKLIKIFVIFSNLLKNTVHPTKFNTPGVAFKDNFLGEWGSILVIMKDVYNMFQRI